MKIFYIIAGIILIALSCLIYGFMDVIAAWGFDAALCGIVSLIGGVVLIMLPLTLDFKE